MSLETIQTKHLPTLDGLRVLDLGCGEGRHSISLWITARARIVGLDLSHPDLLTAQGRKADFDVSEEGEQHYLSFTQASGLELPFRANSFDVVICSEVLEHIPQYRLILDEISRVLITGGVFATSVPRFWPEWICWRLSRAYHEVPGGHVRIFNTDTLRRDIEALDMYCYKTHWAHALHSPYWWLKCLFWSSADANPLVKAYHRLLVWDLMQQPRLTRTLERLLNPLMGKSVAMYFIKGAQTQTADTYASQ